uniref:Uncharacterized protein n=1 Tax=Microcebus murinus TaxID=30608 RepID=A0A8C5YFF4_MICMU
MFLNPNHFTFLQITQHTVNNICVEICMYLVQVDFYKHGRLWYRGVAKRYLCCASCFNLPRFVCFCFTVHHSSVISRRHIESSTGNLRYIPYF